MSQDNLSNNKRIAKNTLMLYFRMLLIMAVGLYSSRVVLQTLGVEDFGIYNVVGGVVTMFGIVSGALSASVSRFLNIEMGKGDDEALRNVFSTSVYIHIFMALLMLILAELFGPWFIANTLTIGSERIQAATWVFHCSLITFAVDLINVPYNACIIAHEDMKVFAYVSIFEALIKLGAVYILLLFSIDKLQLYGILMLMVALLLRVITHLYSRRNYSETHLVFRVHKDLVGKMFGFASWNMFGSLSVTMANQGVNLLINIFCSPIVNAARGIAVQVEQAVCQFSGSFMTALNPQITKVYGSGDYSRYKSLMLNGSKLTVALMALISLPILLETKYILSVWLSQTPEHTISFVQLVLLFAMSEAFSNPLTTGLLATGRIKWLMIFVAGIRLLNFPLSWLSLWIWNIPELTIGISFVLSQICLTVRLVLLKQYVNISIHEFYISHVIRMFFVILLSFSMTVLIIHSVINDSFVRLLISTFFSWLVYVPLLYFIGLDDSEKKSVKNILFNIRLLKRHSS